MVLIFSFASCFKKKKKFMFYASRYHRDTSSTFSISPRYIEPLFSTFYLLNTYVDLLKSSSTCPSIPPNRLNSSCMHFIYFSCFAFFFNSICVHSILFSCFSCRSMVPCSPRSLYVSFLSIFGQVFLAFYALWQSCQKGGEIWDLNVIPQGE